MYSYVTGSSRKAKELRTSPARFFDMTVSSDDDCRVQSYNCMIYYLFHLQLTLREWLLRRRVPYYRRRIRVYAYDLKNDGGGLSDAGRGKNVGIDTLVENS